MNKEESPECSSIADEKETPNLLEDRHDITETIDLNKLFEADVTSSGSFDLRRVKFATFGKLLQAMSVPTLLVASTHEIDFVNHAFLTMLNSDLDPVGSDFSTLFPSKKQGEEVIALLEQVFVQRTPQVLEKRLRIFDAEVWCRIHVRTIRLGGERMVLVQIENLTAQKELNSVQKYRKLVNIFPLGIAEFRTRWPLPCSLPPEQLLDAISHARVADGNNEFARLYRSGTIQDLIDTPLGKLFPMTDNRMMFYEKWIQSGFAVSTFETSEISPTDGTKHFENTVIGNVGDKTLHGFWWMIKDISDRKRMEDELLKTHKLDSLGTLAGGIAHDFNNLLTGILGNISLVREQPDLTERSVARLRDAYKAANRAQDLTRQLSTFSKGGAPIKTTASIAQLLKDCAGFVLRGTSVQGKFSIPDNLWPVDMDAGQISQVIDNLIINASQAMPNGGPVLVRAANVVVNKGHSLPLKEGRYVRVSVADQGTGIPKDHLRKIFDPYFTTKQRGSGLGLATSYSIIKRHGGMVTVRSKVGVGTTFYFFLPASSHELDALTEQTVQEATGKGRILVMDDEELIRKLAKELLMELGYEVSLAREGSEAIDIYKQAMSDTRPFDLVIMDLTIPGGLGGKQTISALLEIDPHVKTIVSSGYSNDPSCRIMRVMDSRQCFPSLMTASR
jgi:two-component system cell cycle sensor histidine kinase/response regulator CckA